MEEINFAEVLGVEQPLSEILGLAEWPPTILSSIKGK